MKHSIAIVGMACRYPDAKTPGELWENVLAKRRAFRRLPDERLRESDYVSDDRTSTDHTYRIQGAVLEGFEFDRQRFRVPGDTFRAADMAHWLALQVAADALEDAGCPDGRDLPRDATGVLLGNTLTGEFSRANVMRLRWPYVRRVVDAALTQENWSPENRRDFLARLEPQYKAPFPEIGGETLAGGLANTIAGRICNQFDLHGGGYTVDGACASSLLAVSQASSALVSGDLDVALAGGVDLSLDPFELVGFARLGALAPHDMHVYDERSSGFWPGEGCGVVVLMREEDAVAQGKRIYATMQGWGISSDGLGGLTRPEVEGQLMAVRRAYKRAGYGADTVTYFEGHGTGTAVGDPAEIQVLSQAITEAAGACPQDRARGDVPRAALGSIKANIGHTKAAAGTAGLIKAVMAVHQRILPPTTACTQPTALLRDDNAALRVLQEAEAWPASRAIRASVSAMGFGGINTHITLSEPQEEKKPTRQVRSRRVVQAAVAASRSSQDSELLCFRTSTVQEMSEQVDALLQYAHKLSLAELTDVSHALARRAQSGRLRAAVLAATPKQLSARLQTLRAWLAEDADVSFRSDPFRSDEAQNIFLCAPASSHVPRIGLLFPGQASPSYFSGGAWSNRFAVIEDLYERLSIDRQADPRETAVAQPAICTAERAGMLALQAWGIEAKLAIGHSVGELAALQWAGVYDDDTLLRLARARGSCMSKFGERRGAMLSIGTDVKRATQLVNGTRVVVAGMNAPEQTIVSGDADDMQDILQRALQQGLQAVELRVSHAFHSPHMAGATAALRDMLQEETWQTPKRLVLSTITGQAITSVKGLTEQLVQQLVKPVRFTEALQAAESQVDLWIECGPGTVLTGLVRSQSSKPVIALDAASASISGLLRAFAACWSSGADLQPQQPFAERFTRPFDLAWQPKFLENPCEAAPHDDASAPLVVARSQAPPSADSRQEPSNVSEHASPLDVVRHTVADHLELPVETVQENSQLLTDLHLNSITISEIVAQAARTLGMQAPQAVTEFANASVGDIASALATLLETGGTERSSTPRVPDGIDRWVRAFEVEWVETPLQKRTSAAAPEPATSTVDQGTSTRGTWKIVAPANHPFEPALHSLLRDGYGEGGVVVCMPAELAGCCTDLMLQGAREVLAQSPDTQFVVVQNLQAGGAPGGGFARTLHLENPRVRTTVIDLPWEQEAAIDWLDQEVAAAHGFMEVRFTADGKRLVPHLQLAQRCEDSPLQLDHTDVLVVTGGGKGIAAECALELAHRTGVRLGLIGRSHPDHDSELADNLQRLQALGAHVHYARADVTDADAVQVAMNEIVEEFGAVTAVLHGAGINQPRLIPDLDEAAFRRTFAPKVLGLRNVLNVIPPGTLRGLITFGSIIGRTGLPGEADYALANEWASRITEMYAERQPECRCLSLEWSVWSGSGMGERLGRIETLRQQGIADIPTDEGIATLIDLMRNPPRSTSVVVAGRFGEPDTVTWKRKTLPLRRFIESPRVHIPGVELVVDAEVSALTDPYLQDHVVQKQPLFPAVLGLEAMAQVAMALQDTDQLPVFEDVQFQHPVVVNDDKTRTIRLAALQTAPHCVTIALRSDANDFHMDHFRALCRFDSEPPADPHHQHDDASKPLQLQAAHLYDGNLLFHQGRFQRLQSYRSLHARSCDADLASDGSTEWFGTYMPRDLCLGDPAARDAAIHAIQACIPHARLLPIGVERIHAGFLQATQPHRVQAKEVSQEGEEYVYDLRIEDASGRLVELWQGLRLRRMERISRPHAWQPELFGAYAERRLQELAGNGQARLAVLRDHQHAADDTTQAALQQAVGGPVTVWRRGDGRPQLQPAHDGHSISATHAQGFTLAISGTGRLGCDLQEVTAREASAWSDLLGAQHCSLAQLLSEQSRCSFDTAATQVWSVMECLKKAGMGTDAPLVLSESTEDGWSTLRSGSVHIATCVTDLDEAPYPMALALLTEATDGGV